MPKRKQHSKSYYKQLAKVYDATNDYADAVELGNKNEIKRARAFKQAQQERLKAIRLLEKTQNELDGANFKA